MRTMLRNLFSFGKIKPDGRKGFIYVRDDETGPMCDAQVGDTVRVKGRGPPWIVVDEALDSIIVAKWPGALWKAEIIEAATAKDQRNNGGPPLPYARYTRCISVRILEEADPASLFGEHGQNVVDILQAAAVLTREQVLRISSERHKRAGDSYDRVFRRWTKARDIANPEANSFDGVISAGSTASGRSPIYAGLSVLHRTIFDRAEEIDGAEAFLHEDDGTPYLAPLWSGAASVMLDAALALGAPQFVSDEDREILLAGWSQL